MGHLFYILMIPAILLVLLVLFNINMLVQRKSASSGPSLRSEASPTEDQDSTESADTSYRLNASRLAEPHELVSESSPTKTSDVVYREQLQKLYRQSEDQGE